MQNPRSRTVYRQRKWPLPAPVRKIVAPGRQIMALERKLQNTLPTVSVALTVVYSAPRDPNGYYVNVMLTGVE